VRLKHENFRKDAEIKIWDTKKSLKRVRIKLRQWKVFSFESPHSGDERGVERRDEKTSGGSQHNASSKEESSSQEACSQEASSQEGSSQEASSQEEGRKEEVTLGLFLDKWVNSQDNPRKFTPFLL